VPQSWWRRVVGDQTSASEIDALWTAGNFGEVDHYSLKASRAEVARLAGEFNRSSPKGILVRHLAAFEADRAVAVDDGPVLLIVNNAGELGEESGFADDAKGHC
jgi:hypothetical protein